MNIIFFSNICVNLFIYIFFRLPAVANYWEHGPLNGGPAIFCGKVMSRNRFLSIQKFLRFSDPAQVDKKNPQTRIESFLDLLRQRCKLVLHPGSAVTVDESLLLWKGLLHFKQCNRYVNLNYNCYLNMSNIYK